MPAAKGEPPRARSGSARSAKDVPVAIGRGENTGHTITYHNVVRRWVKLGDWTGTARTFTVPVRDVTGEGIDRLRWWCRPARRKRPGTDARRAVTPLTLICGVRRLQHAVRAKKIGPAKPSPKSVGGLNRTRNQGPIRPNPGGLGG